MGIASGIVVYLITFWTVLFAVLPWGNRAADVPEGGQAGGAPINPRIKQKFIVTAIISAVIWAIIFLLVHFKIIHFHDIARAMFEEDQAK